MFKWCPWADVLYAMDIAWWHKYFEEAKDTFAGRMVSPQYFNKTVSFYPFDHGANSGQGAIELSAILGVKRIILLGFDAQLTNGQAHCHGDHPPELANAGRVREWPSQFASTAGRHANTRIVNCSRETALKCFPRSDLETELNRRQVYVEGMRGLGDNIYQRAFLCAMSDQDVYLETPWPELYQDMTHVMPVRTETRLRTQLKNMSRTVASWNTVPVVTERRRVSYGSEGILAGMRNALGIEPAALDLPVFANSPVTGRYVVVRPVTIRKEWPAETRNPLPQYVALAAAEMRKRGYTVVSVADLAPGEEWALDPMPEADICYHKGELNVTELLALVRGSAAVIGGIGWIVPAVQALKKPALIICGGQGGYNSPEKIVDSRVDLEKYSIAFVTPDRFCKCTLRQHNCDKHVSNYEQQLTEWADRLPAVV